VPTQRAKSAKLTKPAKSDRSAKATSVVPAELLKRLRTICLKLPGAYEEQAPVGTRWMIRKRNFAHVVRIAGGKPAAYARAADSGGPLVVLTIRSTDMLRDLLRDAGPQFFVPEWGTRWGTKVVGLKLEGKINWMELKVLIKESYDLLLEGAASSPR